MNIHSLSKEDIKLRHFTPSILKKDYNRATPIAIVEAKDAKHSVSFGLQQAKEYAKMMDVPSAELLADYHKHRKALDKQIDDTLAKIQRILGIEIDKETR